MPENNDDKTRTYIPLTSGTMVSHYRIVEKIDAGGMGEVYLAEDTKLNRKVALKFLPVHACQDADRRARFTREAQAAAKLNHPNIVTIYEVGEFNGRPFFAMENVEGKTFRDLRKSKELPLNRIIELAIQVSEGLAKAHSAGVVHRDIKPSNILIDQDGRAKIVDFGLASVHGSEHLTKTGSTLGTVGYMSPEQARGEEADARSDLFSFGVVLYEFIAGRAPFKAESDIATVKNIVEAVPEPLARYKNDVPDDLQRIIDKLLSKDRSLRYQHADDVATDLRRLISSVSSGPTPVIGKRRYVIPIIALLVVAVAVVIFTPWRLMIQPEQPNPRAGIRRVVVVPFKNETSDPSLDPIGTMAANRISQGIMLVGKVEVVQPEVSLGIDTIQGIRAIAKATGANRVVTGVYYKLGDTIQFQGQINDSTERLIAPVKPLYVPVSRVMDGVEEVCQRVMGALESGGAMYRAPLYEAVLKHKQGQKLFGEKIDYATAITHFKRAVIIDTGYNVPWLQMFNAYVNLGQNAEADSTLKILESRRTQLNSAEQLELDRMKAELGHDWISLLELHRPKDKQRPLEANWFMVGYAALNSNRLNEAVEAFRKVDREGTWRLTWTDLGMAYHLLGDHEKELETIREGRRRFPTEVVLYNAELQALAAMGKIEELRKLIEDRPGLPADLAMTATPAGSMRIAAIELRAHGHEEEAMKLLDEAIKWYEAQPPEKYSDAIKGSYAFTLYHARRWARAEIVYEELAKKFPRDSANGRVHALYLGLIAARQGGKAKAMEVSNWLNGLKDPYLYGWPAYQRACISAILGEKEKAVALLKECFLQGGEFGISIHSEFDFESLWDYPPFIELMKPKG